MRFERAFLLHHGTEWQNTRRKRQLQNQYFYEKNTPLMWSFPHQGGPVIRFSGFVEYSPGFFYPDLLSLFASFGEPPELCSRSYQGEGGALSEAPTELKVYWIPSIVSVLLTAAEPSDWK